jgi:Mlc titration factor MtfA (ptsG expression regulator)
LPALILAGLALLFILWLLGQPYWTRRQRDKLRAQSFPDAWRDILKRRVPYVRALPADLQRQLEQHIQVFVAEKAFIGCAGLVMTAAQSATRLLPQLAPDSGVPGRLCGAAGANR